ncbi:hypothetical protein [Halorussus halophilus]|uniref:hypothetical protein n=1 Tax=Halorussus halophilus TaxID=2650975 RepID=UPI001301098F|nr:hypothetical protein [Halorussus halophilus]
MTLTAKETTVAGSSVLAAGLPTLFSLASGGDLTASFANVVFEGDRGAARLWGGFGFGIISLVLIGAAVLGPLNGTYGHLSLALGIASLCLGGIVVVEGGR